MNLHGMYWIKHAVCIHMLQVSTGGITKIKPKIKLLTAKRMHAATVIRRPVRLVFAPFTCNSVTTSIQLKRKFM